MRLRIVFQAIFDNIATPLPCLCLQQLVELIALQAHMPKVMLTVFKINIGAMLFYRRALKYAVDASSPSKWDDKTAHYEILSLPLHEVDTAASEAAADLAAQVAESSLTISRSPPFFDLGAQGRPLRDEPHWDPHFLQIRWLGQPSLRLRR